ncbi:unnamed protein product, partial [Vitis vinifera]|uniref:Uncharacterized protein n=1 Tax=Vitis vinifera TaxID=29760 RepID=D7U1I5_VITVI
MCSTPMSMVNRRSCFSSLPSRDMYNDRAHHLKPFNSWGWFLQVAISGVC